MAEGEKPAGGQTTGIPTVRVVQDVPVIFCDGIANHWFGQGASKLIFSRFDPSMGTVSPSAPQEVPVAQVVMPNEHFLFSVSFLVHRVKMMVDAKIFTQEQVDKSHEYWTNNPDAGKTKNG